MFYVIEWLTRGGTDHYGTQFPEVPGQSKRDVVRDRANLRQRIMGSTEIEKFRSSPSIDFGDKVALIAPPTDRPNAVAVLHCRWKNENSQRDCSLYYGLWERLVIHPISGPGVSVIVFTGHRLEIPERGDNHNYYHSQYCQTLGPKGTEVPREAILLSATHPAWPVAAQDEVQLALCLIIALYGFDGFSRFENEADQAAKWRAHPALREGRAKVRELQQLR